MFDVHYFELFTLLEFWVHARRRQGGNWRGSYGYKGVDDGVEVVLSPTHATRPSQIKLGYPRIFLCVHSRLVVWALVIGTLEIEGEGNLTLNSAHYKKVLVPCLIPTR